MEVYKDIKINDVYVKQNISEDYSSAVIDFSIELNNNAERVEIEIVNLSDKTVNKYTGTENVSLAIDKPKLWWSNGAGDPNIYRYEVILKKDGKTADRKNINVGIRKIELIQEQDSAGCGHTRKSCRWR